MNISQTIKRTCWFAALMHGGPVYLMDWSDYRDWVHSRNPYGKTKEKSIFDYEMTTFREADRDSYWSYYGSGPEFSVDLAKKLLADIDAGIDWDAMKEIEDDEESVFNGTFATDHPSVPIVKGVLILKNGSKYPWVANLNINLSGLAKVLAFMKEWENKTDEEITEALKMKLEDTLTSRDYEFRHKMQSNPFAKNTY